MATANQDFKTDSFEKGSLYPGFFQTLNGQKIAFYESSGKGETLLFVHGHPVWSSYLKNQLDSELGRKYHIISIDFPGCGNSERANDPEKTYSLQGLSGIVSETLKFLGTPCFIAGHSMGANAALHAASQDGSLIKGLFLSGLALLDSAPPEPSNHVMNPDIALVFQKDLSDDECSKIASAAIFKQEQGIHDIIADGLKKTDPRLRLNMLTDLNNPFHTVQHLSFLNSSTIPVALIDGKEDFLTNLSFKKKLSFPKLWKNHLHLVENTDHYLHYENPDAVNTLIDAFITEN